jgi:hypothetical protein
LNRMKLRLGKKQEKQKPQKKVNPLRRACEQFGRQDLYEPLRSAIIINPRLAKKNLKLVLRDRNYRTAAFVMLYESRTLEAEKYFKKALASTKQESPRYRRLRIIIANLKAVAKIARRSWEIDGKYARLKPKKLEHLRRRLP